MRILMLEMFVAQIRNEKVASEFLHSLGRVPKSAWANNDGPVSARLQPLKRLQ